MHSPTASATKDRRKGLSQSNERSVAHYVVRGSGGAGLSLSTLQHNYGDVSGLGARRVLVACFSPRKEQAMPRTSPYQIELTKDERNRLEASVRRYTSAYRDVTRAKIVLLAAKGLPNDEIAARLDTPRQIVSKWRKRFYNQRLAGLQEQPRTGRPPVFPPGGGRGDQSAGVRAARCQRCAAGPLACPGSRPSRHRAGYRRLDLGHNHLAVALGRRHPSLAVPQLDLPSRSGLREEGRPGARPLSWAASRRRTARPA